MPRDPDPADVDVSGRGETQPSSEGAAERFAEHAERSERHNEPSRDPTSVYGPAHHDEAGEATVGRGPRSDSRLTTETDEHGDAEPPTPHQPHPSR